MLPYLQFPCLCNDASIPPPTVFLIDIKKHTVFLFIAFLHALPLHLLLGSVSLVNSISLEFINNSGVSVAEIAKNSKGYDLLLHAIWVSLFLLSSQVYSVLFLCISVYVAEFYIISKFIKTFWRFVLRLVMENSATIQDWY